MIFLRGSSTVPEKCSPCTEDELEILLNCPVVYVQPAWENRGKKKVYVGETTTISSEEQKSISEPHRINNLDAGRKTGKTRQAKIKFLTFSAAAL